MVNTFFACCASALIEGLRADASRMRQALDRGVQNCGVFLLLLSACES